MIEAPVTLVILLVTGIASFLAFQSRDLLERWMFKPREILAGKQYERLITSGFIHADWMHFGFNAISFYSFGQSVEMIYGAKSLLLIYFSSIVGGSLLSLFIHRHHEYRALGASGGVCGVIFASIFLLPGSRIYLFLIPFPIPAFVFAIGFLVLSFVGLRRQMGNIGHDAHLGGALIGLLVATVLYPRLVLASPWMFAAVVVLSLGMMVTLIWDPLRLREHRPDYSFHPLGGERSRRYEANRSRNERLAEIDRLLDKVANRGIESLSKSERERLNQLSKEVNGEH